MTSMPGCVRMHHGNVYCFLPGSVSAHHDLFRAVVHSSKSKDQSHVFVDVTPSIF